MKRSSSSQLSSSDVGTSSVNHGLEHEEPQSKRINTDDLQESDKKLNDSQGSVSCGESERTDEEDIDEEDMDYEWELIYNNDSDEGDEDRYWHHREMELTNDDDDNFEEREEEEEREREEEEVDSDSVEADTLYSSQPPAANLPYHVLQSIFSCLSPEDLCNCLLVCQRWRFVGGNKKSFFWKKGYTRFKRQGKKWTGWSEIQQIIDRHQLSNKGKCFMNTARLVQLQFKNKLLLDVGDSEEVHSILLHSHPQYSNALKLLDNQKRFRKSKYPILAAVVSLIAVLSHDVFEVRRLFRMLTSPGGPCQLAAVVELFYCLATICYYLWRQKVLPQRFHYNVYYVLATFEQPDCSDLSTCRQLTHEQCRIVHHPIGPGDVVKVVAFAGTGKTTTLIHLAHQHPDKKFLYLVYNKSVKENAARLFPTNVTCLTIHALIFKETGWIYKNHGKIGNVRLTDLPQIQFDDDIYESSNKDRMVSMFEMNKYCYRALLNFFRSTDETICSQHLPNIDARTIPSVIKDNFTVLMVKQTKLIWEAMKDVYNRFCTMEHDGYVKIFQLRRPRPIISDYHCMLIDEAQDLSPAVLDILSHQTCPRIFVGDPHQQIYSFRGAVNAIELINATHTYYLTKSFRFGPNIAFLASVVLSELKSVHSQTITGGLQDGGYAHTGIVRGKYAVITRTNSGLISEVISVLSSSRDAIPRLGFTGVGNSYFQQFKDVYFLKHNERDKIVSNKIKKYKSFDSLVKYADESEDLTLLHVIKVCKNHKDIPRYINLIYQNKVKSEDIDQADIIFSTTHRAKGLEFNTVQLGTDFFDRERALDNIVESDADEKNLLYVAITRAKRRVLLNSVCVKVLRDAGEHPLVRCVPSVSAADHGGLCCTRTCVGDREVHTTLPIHQLAITPGDNCGPLCQRCVIKLSPVLSFIFRSQLTF